MSKSNKTNSKPSKSTKPQMKANCSKGNHGNDASWYKPNEQLVHDSTHIIPNMFPGYPVRVQNLANRTDGQTQRTLPHSLSYQVIPTVGDGRVLDKISGAVYTWLRSRQKINENFDHTDYFMYLIATAQILSFYVFLRRTLGLRLMFSAENNYNPWALIKAANIDPQSMNNLDDCRNQLNELGMQINTLVVPSGFKYFNRQIFLYDAIYAEEPLATTRYHQYVPGWFWKYDETASSTGTCLRPVKVGRGQASEMSFNGACALLQGMISAVKNSMDALNYQATTLNAWDDADFISVPMVPTDYAATIVYNEEVLRQFQNVRLAGFVPQSINQLNNQFVYVNGVDPTASGAVVKSIPWGSMAMHNAVPPIIDFDANGPTEDAVLVNTRLCPAFFVGNLDFTETTGVGDFDIYGGTELINALILTGMEQTSTGMVPFYEIIGSNSATLAALRTSSPSKYYHLQQFKFAPHIVDATTTPGTGSTPKAKYTLYGYFGDVTKGVVVSSESALEQIHRCALYGEFWNEKVANLL